MSTQTIKLNLNAISPSIEARDGTYYIAQSPITFAAVILRFQEGLWPDAIRRECFPSLPLSHVYSAISFYLNHPEQVDDYLKQVKQEEDKVQERLLKAHPDYIKTAEELRDRINSVSRQ